jgi:uncharacterized protein (DUF302 family)
MTLARFALAAACLITSMAAQAAEGLVAVRSPHSPADTANRLEAALKQRNLTLFARIDHAAGAAKIGQNLRATEVFIFGNPQGGTPLMACQQSAGIDLPLKALVWQDEKGQTWFGYNNPTWIATRHGAADCPVVPNLVKALEGIAAATTAP